MIITDMGSFAFKYRNNDKKRFFTIQPTIEPCLYCLGASERLAIFDEKNAS